MAVYTPVPEDTLIEFLRQYHIGDLESYKGIEAGVSNTNYHLYAEGGHYILTLFEPHRVREEDIAFFLDYTDCMARAGIPCPAVIADAEGRKVNALCDRPAVIFEFLDGDGGHAGMVTPAIMWQVGALNARMHKEALALAGTQDNHFGLTRWQSWLDAMGAGMDKVAPGLYATCRAEFDAIKAAWPDDLPRGAIHGDLFPDNVFFDKGHVSGVIDFHFVCTDFFAYEIAIVANAWCFDADNNFEPECFNALMDGYQSVRRLDAGEKAALPMFLRAASLRFLLSRAEEYINHKPDNLMKPHDPLVFLTRLKHFQTHG